MAPEPAATPATAAEPWSSVRRDSFTVGLMSCVTVSVLLWGDEGSGGARQAMDVGLIPRDGDGVAGLERGGVEGRLVERRGDLGSGAVERQLHEGALVFHAAHDPRRDRRCGRAAAR